MTKNKKKILFICQYFYPEVFRGNDMAFYLANEGHHVHVVAGTPNYPSGKFYAGYGIFKKRNEVLNGVNVTHLPIFPRGTNIFFLLLNYFSYLIVGSIYIFFHALFHKYNLVLCQQLSPVMMSTPAVIYKKLRKVPLYTWVLDLWPDSITAAGGISNKSVISFFDWFVKLEYKWSDKILISSRSFEQNIINYGDYKAKIIYYPQWSDVNTSKYSTQSNISIPTLPECFTVMFAGAIGEAHGFECNLRAALLTKEHKDIKWVIVGDGRKLPWVRLFVKENCLEDTVIILGHYPSDTMHLFFEKADVMLVSLSDSPLFNMYAPAKISSYMASSRPIIACLNGEGGNIVRESDCGWCVNAGDAEALAKLVIEISKEDKAVLYNKGKSGRAYYNEHFDKDKNLRRLDDILGLN